MCKMKRLDVAQLERLIEGLKTRVAPQTRFELATLRLTAEKLEILNALSCVAYRETRRSSVPQLGYLGYHLAQSWI